MVPETVFVLLAPLLSHPKIVCGADMVGDAVHAVSSVDRAAVAGVIGSAGRVLAHMSAQEAFTGGVPLRRLALVRGCRRVLHAVV